MSVEDPDDIGRDEALLERLLQAVARADRQSALELAGQAEKAGIDHPLVLVLAAEAAEAQGQDLRATDLLRSAIEIAPEQAETWRRLSLVLGKTGQLEQARAAADQALALSPNV